MTIRLATKKDIDTITQMRLLNAQFHANLLGKNVLKPKAEIEVFFRNHTTKMVDTVNAKILMITEQEDVVGYVIGILTPDHPIFDFGKNALVDDVYIRPDFQGKGYGKALVNNLFDWFRTENVDQIQLNVYVTNDVARHFWQKMGFSIRTERMIQKLTKTA
ncbi:MAG: GNAT family N-acetyltransferase [Chitinophagales bacterium]